MASHLTSPLCLIITVNTVIRRPFKSNSSLFFILFKVNYAPKRLYLYGNLHLELSKGALIPEPTNESSAGTRATELVKDTRTAFSCVTSHATIQNLGYVIKIV